MLSSDSTDMPERRKTIVLVDDDLVNLKVGRITLGGKYNVFTMLSAGKMFSLLEKHVPDLILLDIVMPEMDGFEAIKILKSNASTRDIPVIFLTGAYTETKELQGRELGAVDFITKPFYPSQLLERIDEVLGK
ncbi:MAG: response regulator [Desulfovibrio sp.]|jgi:putative two-component system response regulator|nr:response regulator [Desulfovibrio sp.]